MAEEPVPDPPSARSPLPIWASIVAAYRLVGWHLTDLIRGGWLAGLLMLVAIGLLAVTMALAGQGPPRAGIGAGGAMSLIALGLATYLLMVSVAVRWYRVLLLGEVPRMGIVPGRREFRYIGYSLVAGLLATLPAFGAFLLAALVYRGAGAVVAVLLIMAGLGITAWLAMRYLVTGMLASVDRVGNLLGASWQLMQGLAWRGFWAVILTALPVIVVNALFRILLRGSVGGQLAATLLGLLLNVGQMALLISVTVVVFAHAAGLRLPSRSMAGIDLGALPQFRRADTGTSEPGPI
jgi:hypothetical protein